MTADAAVSHSRPPLAGATGYLCFSSHFGQGRSTDEQMPTTFLDYLHTVHTPPMN